MDVYKFNIKKDIQNKEIFKDGSFLLLGKFEVFHKGHNQLLNYAKKERFENQPIGIFIIEKSNNNFQSLQDKLNNFASLELDYVIVATFDVEFKLIEGKDFIEYLSRNFNVKEFVVGEDFRFGKNRFYKANDIENISNSKVKIIPSLKNEHNIKISGSSIQKMHEFGEYNLINNFIVNPLVFDVEIKNNKIIWNLDIVRPQLGNYYFMILIDDYWYHGIIRFSINNNVFFKLINFDENNFILNQKTKIKIIDVERIIISSRFDEINEKDIEKAKMFFN